MGPSVVLSVNEVLRGIKFEVFRAIETFPERLDLANSACIFLVRR